MIPWLVSHALFPPIETALATPNGLLAAGGELSPDRLIEAYRSGIFPWFNEGEPILWWSPDPRMVILPSELRVSRSLNKNASKIAFVQMMRQLQRWGFGMVDCQMKTAHLASFGAREIPRIEFSQRLAELISHPDRGEKWHFDDQPVE